MRARPHRWLALLPAAGFLIGAPLANRVHAYVLGLPFLLTWIVGCVLATSVVMAVIHALDDRADAAAGVRDRGRAAAGSAAADAAERRPR